MPPTETKRQSGSRKPARDPRDTPAMRQYFSFKQQHPGCVLFFRMGDFYEMFDDDAETVHRALGLTLTARNGGIPMAGIPHHQLEPYLRRMIDAGYRVAVCDQVQDPKEATGVVERAVTRVVTPGTLVDESLLDDGVQNLVAAVDITNDRASIAVAEVSTGRFSVLDTPLTTLGDELARLGAAEVIYAEQDDGNVPATLARAIPAERLTERPAWMFDRSSAAERLTAHFRVRTLAGFGFDDGDEVIGAAGALLGYLLETQSPGGTGASLAHLEPPRRRGGDTFVQLDATSLRSLEIERTMRAGTVDGSLLSTIAPCATAMGKRLLRQWLCFPLRERGRIEARQAAVAALVDDRRFAEELTSALGGVQDVARIAGRLGLGRATPRDLAALGGSVARAAQLSALVADLPAFEDIAQRLAAIADSLAPLAERIVKSCVEDPPAHMREGGLIRDGVDSALDETRTLERDANSWLAAYQERIIEETGITSLRVGYNRVFGYYIEITHANREKVPDTFSRRQTLKNAERYITPELKEFEDAVLSARDRSIERERTLFDELCAAAAAESATISVYADVVARLDVLGAFATTAVRSGFVRPELTDERVLDITGGRHPVLDRALRERFVPNDCQLGVDAATLALITGPNMAGKSTAIRQAALITLLAHTGSFVPAESARVGLVDRIFTRVGAADELHTGQSTFMVEMTEAANILHHATDRSLVILDEIGRGTSTYDGLSLAWAIAEAIADCGCRALFATHYHELTRLADDREDVTNLHVAVREWGDEIVFLYRIQPGRTDRSYGIHVARIAGLPPQVITRAGEVLDHLGESSPQAEPPAPRSQMMLFEASTEPHPALDRLRELSIDSMTPLDAFDALRALIEQARSE